MIRWVENVSWLRHWVVDKAMQSFLQFIAEAKDIDLDLGAYGSWLNLKTGKVVKVGFEKHTDIDVVKKLGPFAKKFEAEMRLLRLPSGRAGIAMVEKILKKPWAKLTHPAKPQRRWGIQVNKKYIKQLWKWMGPWLKDGRDEVYVDDDRGINLGHFMLDMPRDKRAIKRLMEQVITEAKDIDLDPRAYGGWLNVKSGKVVNVGFEKHTAPEVLDKLGFDKEYRANIGSGFAHEKIMKHPWVKLIYPSKHSRTWAVQANKKFVKQVWKWLGPWLKDTEDRVYVDDDRSLRLGRFDLNLPRDMRAIKQMMEQVIVTEVFDNPYKWSGGGRVRKGSMTPDHQSDIETYKFKTSDGEQVEMFANHFWLNKGTEMLPALEIKKEGHAIGLEFTKNATYSMTGKGDAMRILATILDITKAIIKKHKPSTVYFSADKEKTTEPGVWEKSGRAGAYGAIVKRFAGKMGYKSSATDDAREVRWQLTKK